MTKILTHLTRCPLAALLTSALCVASWPGSAGAQSMVGVVSGNPGDGSLHIELKPAASVQVGHILHIVRYDSGSARWFPAAEVVISAATGNYAMARITEMPTGSTFTLGDSVAVYDVGRDNLPTLRLRPRQLDMIVGETERLIAELVDRDGNLIQSVGARWRSTVESVAAINDDGSVVALAPGEVVVVAQATAGLVATAIVHVRTPTLSAPDSIVAFAGVRDTIRVLLTGAASREVAARSFQWSIADTRVAFVDAQGIITPLAPGATQLNITGLNRSFKIPVQVLPAPAEIMFLPALDSLHIVRGERLSASLAVRMASGEVVHGLTPRLHTGDPTIIEIRPDGGMRGLREGTALVYASGLGSRRSWVVSVRPPELSLDIQDRLALLGDSVRAGATLIGTDGRAVGEAVGVVWHSSDPTIAEVREGWVHTRGFGSATISAFVGDVTASSRVHVTGDLLLTVEGLSGRRVHSLSVPLARLGPPLLGDRTAWAPAISPDRLRIAFVAPGSGPFGRIHVAEPDGSRMARVTPEVRGLLGIANPMYHEHAPEWRADGTTVFFLSSRSGSYAPYAIDLDTGLLHRLAEGSQQHLSLSAAHRSPVVAIERTTGAGATDIILTRLDGSTPQAVVSGRRQSGRSTVYAAPKLLPDGRGMVATRRNSGSGLGEELVLIEFGNNEDHRIRSLVPSRRNEEIVFALSNDGVRVAYAIRKPFGGSSTSVIIMGIDGVVVATIPVPAIRIHDIAWATEGTK
jgi:hypothetical protein